MNNLISLNSDSEIKSHLIPIKNKLSDYCQSS